MKKTGFTLAEVLIALGIVGVIAAITIPSFTANTQNQANASRLSATVSTLENAFTAMVAGESADDLSNTPFIENRDDNSLLRYLKGASCVGNGSTYYNGTANPYLTISGSANNTGWNANSPACMLKSGAIFVHELGGDDSSQGVLLDVNGAALPNRFGRDVFCFLLNYEKSVLIPEGNNGGWRNSCSDANRGNGIQCTARLIENNYKVDY